MFDTTARTRRTYCPVSITVAVISAAVMLAGIIVAGTRLFEAGLLGLMLAATALIALRTGVNTEVIEHARQAGYDAGYAARDELGDSDAHVRQLHAI